MPAARSTSNSTTPRTIGWPKQPPWDIPLLNRAPYRESSKRRSTSRQFLANVVAANDLELVKSVKPVYPAKAEAKQTEGWVELDFTVAESGEVRDVAVHAANPLRNFRFGSRQCAVAMAV